jgi:hypothetical protein
MTTQLYRVFGRDGEYDRRAMRDLIRRGEVTSLTDVALSGSEEWKSAGMVPELQRYLALASTPRTTPPAAAAARSASTKQIAIVVLLIVAGLFFGFSGTVDLFRGLSSLSWPAAYDAQMISGDVIGSSSYRRSRRSRSRLRVVYRYRAAGRLYLGDRVSFGREWLTTAQGQLNESRRHFAVYYNASMPKMSVMRRGPTLGAATAALMGWGAVLAGALALFKPELLEKLRRRKT